MFQSILVPIDGSGPSFNALGVAIDMAQRYGARLGIVHAVQRNVSEQQLREIAERHGFLDQVSADFETIEVQPPIMATTMGVPIMVIPDELLEKIGRLLLETAAASAKAGGLRVVETALLDPTPAKAILQHADSEGYDAIVVGSRGLGGITGFFLGSVSHKLIADAPCPCMVVK